MAQADTGSLHLKSYPRRRNTWPITAWPQDNGPATHSWKELNEIIAKILASLTSQVSLPIEFEGPENQRFVSANYFTNIKYDNYEDVSLPATRIDTDTCSVVQELEDLFLLLAAAVDNEPLTNIGFMARCASCENLRVSSRSPHVKEFGRESEQAWPKDDDERLWHSEIDSARATLGDNLFAEPSRNGDWESLTRYVLANLSRSCEDMKKEGAESTTKRMVLVRDESEFGSGITNSGRTALSARHQPMKAVTCPELMWNPGQTIVVCFLDGTQEQHNFVTQCFREYDVNLTFDFIDVRRKGNSDVRITFEGGVGFQSLVGSKALEADTNDATMWLCPKYWSESPALRGRILHEGLHMLGFEHEHSSPNSQIKWIQSEAYDYYARTEGWDRETTHLNVLDQQQADKVVASDYDPTSIMHYKVVPSLTQDGSHVPQHHELSEMDKKTLRQMYEDGPQIGSHAALPSLTLQVTDSSSLPPLAFASQTPAPLTITFQCLQNQVGIMGLYCILLFLLG